MARQSQKPKVLIVEDERSIREMVRFILEDEDFEIHEAEDIHAAKAILAQTIPDLILLDWMLPGGSGIELTHYVRQDEFLREIAIIMLTAKAEEENRVKGLETGADDYIVKPFSPRELVARVKAVLRRGPLASPDDVLQFKALSVDLSNHDVTANGRKVRLGPTEFRLLKFLMSHQKRVYTREQILYYIWGRDTEIEERTVDVHIRRLRKQLEDFGYDHYIQTVRSMGYMFSESIPA